MTNLLLEHKPQITPFSRALETFNIAILLSETSLLYFNIPVYDLDILYWQGCLGQVNIWLSSHQEYHTR